MEEAKSSSFKVIVVGGGPVGLTAAQMFTKAGIDFLILERGSSVFPDLGASLALHPSTMRILDQLDLLEPIQALGTPMIRRWNNTIDGETISSKGFFQREIHGIDLIMLHRADLLKTLYDTLPESSKDRILKDKTVTDVEILDNGVRVSCEDGSSYEGSMVIGADGIHSGIRKIINERAPKALSKPSNGDSAKFKATYKVMFGNATRPAAIEPSNVYESHGDGCSSQLFVGKERMWFFVYKKLHQPTSEKKRYTQEEVEAYADELGDIHMTPDLLLRDLFKNRNNAGLTNLEEGIAERWNWKRIILVGDAAHKVTPNIGWGYNSGVADMVTVTNLLRDLLSASLDGRIDAEKIEETLANYEPARIESMSKIAAASAKVTRLSAWDGRAFYFMDRYLIPLFHLDWAIFRYLTAPLVSNLPILSFLEEKHRPEGCVPWVH